LRISTNMPLYKTQRYCTGCNNIIIQKRLLRISTILQIITCTVDIVAQL
jgi:hypothetical protein